MENSQIVITPHHESGKIHLAFGPELGGAIIRMSSDQALTIASLLIESANKLNSANALPKAQKRTPEAKKKAHR